MSYLINNVQNISPNSSGNINISLEQMSDFAGNPLTNNKIVFSNSSNWVPGTFPNKEIGDDGYNYFGKLTTGSPGIASNTQYDVGNRFIFRRSSGTSAINSLITPNTTVATTAGVGGSSSQWYMSFNVTSGNWLFYSTIPIRPYSSSTMTLQWTDGTNYYGPKLEMSQSFKCPDVHIAYISLNSTTEVWLEVMASNNSYLHAANQHEAVSFNFIKVS